MNNSTENVTIAATFIIDILEIYKTKSEKDYKVLKKMTDGLNLSNPMNMVPISVYNEMCDWIEQQLGQANTRIVGRQIGKTAFDAMKNNNLLNEKSTPLCMAKALQIVATSMIKDSQKRGWEILESAPKHIVLRRTQTFNSTLQFGLLDELVRKVGVSFPKVEYLQSVKNGDEFDEYKISWI